MDKKEKYIIGVSLVAGAGLLLWLLSGNASGSASTTDAGSTPDTGYLTYNLPALDSSGEPTFGDTNYGGLTYIAGGSGGSNTGCGSCSGSSYYGSTAQLAAASYGLDSQSTTDFYGSAPDYLKIFVNGQTLNGDSPLSALA